MTAKRAGWGTGRRVVTAMAVLALLAGSGCGDSTGPTVPPPG